MSELSSEFAKRRQFAETVRYDDTARLVGFFDWMLQEPRIAKIVQAIEESSPFADLLARSSPREPPTASTPEEVASVAFQLLRQARGGASLVDKLVEYGIVNLSLRTHADDVLFEGMQRYIGPSLDYVEMLIQRPSLGTEVDAVVSGRLDSVLTRALKSTCPRTWDLLRRTGDMFASTASDANWSNVANSCRQAMITVVDEMVKAGRLPATPVKRGDVKGAIAAAAKHPDMSGRVDDALVQLVAAIWNYLQPLIHRSATSLEEAERAYVWTVLGIGELWRITL